VVIEIDNISNGDEVIELLNSPHLNHSIQSLLPHFIISPRSNRINHLGPSQRFQTAPIPTAHPIHPPTRYNIYPITACPLTAAAALFSQSAAILYDRLSVDYIYHKHISCLMPLLNASRKHHPTLTPVKLTFPKLQIASLYTNVSTIIEKTSAGNLQAV
jgi:hypothetical protein